MTPLTKRPAWKALAAHSRKVTPLHLRKLFAADPKPRFFENWTRSCLTWTWSLVMTVNPGFGHQHFIPTMLPKIRRVRGTIERVKPDCELELDGGIDETTAPLGVAAGANVLVAGTSVFGNSSGVAGGMNDLRTAIEQATN